MRAWLLWPRLLNGVSACVRARHVRRRRVQVPPGLDRPRVRRAHVSGELLVSSRPLRCRLGHLRVRRSVLWRRLRRRRWRERAHLPHRRSVRRSHSALLRRLGGSRLRYRRVRRSLLGPRQLHGARRVRVRERLRRVSVRLAHVSVGVLLAGRLRRTGQVPMPRRLVRRRLLGAGLRWRLRPPRPLCRPESVPVRAWVEWC